MSQAIEHYKPIIIDDKIRSGFQPIRLLLTSSVQITHTYTHTILTLQLRQFTVTENPPPPPPPLYHDGQVHWHYYYIYFYTALLLKKIKKVISLVTVVIIFKFTFNAVTQFFKLSWSAHCHLARCAQINTVSSVICTDFSWWELNSSKP